jgi:hypothetical protein
MKLGMLILSALVDVAEICIVKKASSTIQEKIKKSFFHNLKILFIFMLGVSAIYFFPGKKNLTFIFFNSHANFNRIQSSPNYYNNFTSKKLENDFSVYKSVFHTIVRQFTSYDY